MNSYQVRIWDVRKIGDTARGRHRVRWSVDGREHCKSFPARAHADAFAATLRQAARDGTAFDAATGVPARAGAAGQACTWYEHARSYADMKWPELAPKSRRSVAEALTTITVALTAGDDGGPGAEVTRRALFGYAFNRASASRPVPAEIAAVLARVAAASPPLAALDDLALVRTVLAACARTLDGRPAGAATARRKRAVFHNALGYAVEVGLLAANPAGKIRRSTARVAEAVDRRVVVSPAQAAALLAAVRAQGDRGEHLEAFFGCLYYAALRPSEAVALRDADLVLPDGGWGRIDLAASEPRAGTEWTDTGAVRQARGLKHRARAETRSIPIPPALVELLRHHLKRYGSGTAGRMFRTARGGPVQDTGYGEVWQRARAAALTPAQAASPLARRPYDLRHAAVSLWLNAGVPVAEVARRAGHGVAVLLKVYANCVDGQSPAANHRISDALEGDRGTKSSGGSVMPAPARSAGTATPTPTQEMARPPATPSRPCSRRPNPGPSMQQPPVDFADEKVDESHAGPRAV